MLIVAAAAYRPVKNWWDLRQFKGIDLASIGAPASVCGKVETKPADGNQQHVPTGTQVTYTTAPPAFGSHWNEQGVAPAPFNRKFYTDNDRPELEALVHNLEHGYTILWYDESIADDADELNVIDGIADKFRSDTDNFRYKFIAAPWTSDDEKESGKFPDGMHVAFSHWSAGGSGESDTSKQVGVFQYCTRAERRGAQRLHAGLPLHRLARAGRDVMGAPERIAIVSGYFNPIHIGHLRMIKAASELAPHLVVIVNNDRQQLLKKGRILMTEDDRLAIVAELRSVDEAFVAVDDDATVVASLRRVRELLPGRRAALLQRRRPVPRQDGARARRPTSPRRSGCRWSTASAARTRPTPAAGSTRS